MDTRFIQTLLAVVEAGSFAAAARRLNLTPAAVAQRIKVIETELDQPLIVRAGQKVAPTQACLSILPRFADIVTQVGQIAADLDMSGLGGPMRIGAISTALSDRVPNVLRQFAKQAPTAKITVVPGNSKDLYAMLLAGDIDAAFVVQPPFDIPKAVRCVPIETHPFVMIVSSEDQRSMDAIIADERALIYDATSWGGKIAASWIDDKIPDNRILCELDALETIAIAVGHGVGFSIVPNWRGLTTLASVRRIPLPDLSETRDTVLLHRGLNEVSLQLLCS